MDPTGSTKVGQAHVQLTADPSQLNTGVDAAQAKVEQFAQRSEVATKKASGGFNTLGKDIRNTIKPITSLVGSVTAAIGTFGLFVNIGERIGRGLFGLNEQGQTKDEALKGDTDAVVRDLLQSSRGQKPLDPKIAASFDQQAAIDKRKIERSSFGERLRRAIGVFSPGGLVGAGAGRSFQELYGTSSTADLDAEGARLAQATGRYARSQRAAPTMPAPASFSGFSSSDPAIARETLRVLRRMDMSLQRRGADE